MTDPRYSIGVDQSPFGGDSYPLVDPPAAVAGILADLYLAYTEAEVPLELPLRLVWLYGFGDQSVSPPSGYPTPTHDRDLLIVDAQGRTAFDSTEASDYFEEDWGDYHRILEWRDGRQILRVVQRVASEAGLDEYLETDAVINARAIKRIRPQLTGLLVTEQLVDAAEIVLAAGYNMRLDVERLPVVEGQKRVTRITLNALPGAGEGRYPDCSGDNRYLRALMGQRPDSQGNLILSGDECYRVTVPYEIVDGVAQVTPHTLQLVNDCVPCSDCDDHIRVYRAVSNIHDQQAATYVQLDETRAAHQENIARWNAQKACREQRNQRLVVVSQEGGVVAVAGAFSNTTEECLWDVEFRFTFRVLNGGSPVPPANRQPNFVAGSTHAGGTNLDGTVPYSLGGTWPAWFTRYDQVASGDTNFVRFGLTFTPEPGDALEVTFTTHSPHGAGIGLPAVGVSGAIEDLWTTAPNGPAIAVTKRLVPLYPGTPGSPGGGSGGSVPEHTHPMADVENLVEALASKANVSHGHAMEDVSGLDDALAGKANVSHGHVAADVTSGTFDDARIAQSSVTQHQGAIDHGSIAGLSDDDHTQYAKTDGTRWTASPAANRVAVSNASGHLVCGDITTAELAALGNITGNIELRLNSLEGALSSDSDSGGVTDHGDLDGLGDDDHSQYALLAGRTGGQTLHGGTGAGEALTLAGTSHGTKGPVIVGNSLETPAATITVSTTLTAAHHTVYCNNSSDIVVDVADPATCAGRAYWLEKISNNTNLVEIEDHNGDPLAALIVQGDWAVIASDGTSWQVFTGSLAGHRAVLRRTTTQSIASTTNTQIVSMTVQADVGGIAGTDEIVIKRPGQYLILVSANGPTLGNSDIWQLHAFLNGASYGVVTAAGAAISTTTGMAGAFMAALDAGDVVDLRCLQFNPGASSRNVSNATLTVLEQR